MLGVPAAELLDCRFAVSPLFELGGAVRATHRDAGRRWHLPWLDEVLRRTPPAGLAVLQAMQPSRGYTPDFLAPTPGAPGVTVEDEVERVGRTPLDQLAHELARCRADQGGAARAVLDDLLTDPQRARGTVVEALLSCWQELLAAHWPRVRHLLERDVAHRAQGLVEHGLTHVLADLHPDVRYADGLITVGGGKPGVQQRRDVDGAGLVLMPSAFTWPAPLAVLDPPWQPTVIYPARGVAALWERAAPDPTAALVGVLGRGRARILTDLAEPDDTTSIARRYDMAASSVSRHLRALHDAGLVDSSRRQRRVLYQRTALGTALVRGQGHGSDGSC